MERRKLTKQDIDKVRDIEGFPIGTDEDIIALSDAPYYTACPNPFIEEFIQENGHPYDEETDDYQREPFSSDVSEGKTDPIYMAHSYHTKVPHKAIMHYILHYTNPGDIIYDGFAGTGQTGVAAQMCRKKDESLQQYHPQAQFGARKVILNDLSPVASFIARNYNASVNPNQYMKQAEAILHSVQTECGWMYETIHRTGNHGFITDSTEVKGHINYTVWSDVLICPNCGQEIVFYNAAFNKTTKAVEDVFECGNCHLKMKKADCARATTSSWDEKCGEMIAITKQVPVLINYSVGKTTYEKEPDEYDLDVIKKIEGIIIPYDYPTTKMMLKGEKWGDSWRAGYHLGISRVHHFFTKRNLYTLAKTYDSIKKASEEYRGQLLFTYEQLIWGMSKLARYVPTHYSQVNQYLSGTLYIGSQVVEVSPEYIIEKKIKNLAKVFGTIDGDDNNYIVSTSSTAALMLPENSVDYIFTDPPFGDNLMYSELSFMWEAWLRVITNNTDEAIVSNSQQKTVVEYQGLMTKCFEQYYHALKPNRWITVEFHNSRNAVWNAIQESLLRAGFIIADVRTLDKKQSSFKQVVSMSAVKQDLVISAYKPKDSFTKDFKLKAGTERTAWAFVRQHLQNLPITIKKGGKLEVIAERQAFLLWDRMVAYHIMRGIAVPMDAADFYKGLDEKYVKRDGMYFLPNQANKYDVVRATCEVQNIQFSFFVQDEKSAIGWLYQQLDPQNGGEPQTYQELMPKFMQELKAVDKREKMPELMVILEENFLKDDKGRWYIPDYTKSGDIAKLREKNLLKEFAEYQVTKGKLKVFRSEAIRAGFAKLWKDKDYNAIVEMAERLPEETIQEDSNLLMYYDISLSRAQSQPTQMKIDME